MKRILKSIVLFTIFVCGYICGRYGVDTIISSIILNLSDLDLIEIIGFSSSIATLILFVAYIFGKYLIIQEMKTTIFEKVSVDYNNEQSNLKIVEEYSIGRNNVEQVFLYSSDTLKWIKIYEYNYNEKNGSFNKGKVVAKHGLLRNGFAIKVNTYLPCGIPSYIIEYQRYDFIIGNLILAENGKNGVVDERLSTKHTIKSILYYLVK